MQTYKRPAAMIAAAVVALAMVTPTAALASNGDRGKDRGHEASERRDHDSKSKYDSKSTYDGKAKADSKADGKAKSDYKAKDGKRAGEAEQVKADRRETRDAKATPTRTKTDKRTSHDKSAKDRTKVESDAREKRGGPWNVKAPLCHATSSETNPYVMITVSHKSIVKGKGHGGHADDIIPPFTYRPSRDAAPVEFPGQNWDDEGRAIFDAGCLVAADEVAQDEVDDDKDDATDTRPDGDEVRGRWNVKAPLCHATSSETNPYVMITVSHKSIVKDAGHGAHADDIIPPFAYQPHRGAESAVYPGLNWDAEGRELFANGCVLPTDGEVEGVDGTDGTDDTDGTDGTDGTDDTDDTTEDVAADTDDDVLGVVIDADETGGDSAVDDEVLGVSVEDDTAATADDTQALADTEVQAAQASDEEGSTGVLAMTGGSLLVLLIAGLASLSAGTGLLRRRS